MTQVTVDPFSAAKEVMPGGVNSPVRSFKSVGGEPTFIRRGKGSRLWGHDGREYIDFVGSWGAAILGHAHPEVVAAVKEAADDGLSFGLPTEQETKLARFLVETLPAVDKIRLVSSGTEACMSAVRLARGFTGRTKIMKFDGHYHGHSDALLIEAGSGVATLALPGSSGVPAAAVESTLSIPFNDIERLEEAFHRFGTELAAVIFEPIVGNVGFIRPQPGFLQRLRALCTQHGALFIMDEVMTGFRVAWGGAQVLFDLKPDLTTLGKAIGGGMPLAAYGGREDIMARIAPLGDVYQAGTLSGNPVAVAAGLRTLEILERDRAFPALAHVTGDLVAGFKSIAQRYGVPLCGDHEGGMFGLYFRESLPKDYEEAKQCDTVRFKTFFRAMLNQGVYLAPSPFEAGFVSMAHSMTDVSLVLEAAESVFKKL